MWFHKSYSIGGHRTGRHPVGSHSIEGFLIGGSSKEDHFTKAILIGKTFLRKFRSKH